MIQYGFHFKKQSEKNKVLHVLMTNVYKVNNKTLYKILRHFQQ